MTQKALPASFEPIKDPLNARRVLGRRYAPGVSLLTFYRDNGLWFDAGSNYGDTFRYDPRTKIVMVCTESCDEYITDIYPPSVTEHIQTVQGWYDAL